MDQPSSPGGEGFSLTGRPRARDSAGREDVSVLSQAYLFQVAASGAAVAALVGLAAWARIARPLNPLDDATARFYLGEEFPGRAIDRLWVATDGAGALARSGASALVLCR